MVGPVGGDPRSHVGKMGETLACEALRRRGYAILDRRFRTRAGELDIVARHGATIVFVEVKARLSGRFGGPLDAVTRRKQRRICAMAAEYVTRRRLAACACRFDVVGVTFDPAGKPAVEVIPGAFDWVSGRYA